MSFIGAGGAVLDRIRRWGRWAWGRLLAAVLEPLGVCWGPGGAYWVLGVRFGALWALSCCEQYHLVHHLLFRKEKSSMPQKAGSSSSQMMHPPASSDDAPPVEGLQLKVNLTGKMYCSQQDSAQRAPKRAPSAQYAPPGPHYGSQQPAPSPAPPAPNTIQHSAPSANKGH